MEFTLGEESEKPSKKGLTDEELSKHLDRLLEEKANNQRIYDWAEVSVQCFGCDLRLFNQTLSIAAICIMGIILCTCTDWRFSPLKANLDEQEMGSNQFVRALMMSVCQSAIICEWICLT